MSEKRRINLGLGYVESQQLDDLCNYFRETPTPTIKRCINEMHKKHENQLNKIKETNK